MYLAPQSIRPRGGTYQLGAALSRRRVRYLGSITPDQAAQSAMPLSQISKTPGFTQAVYNSILAAAQQGNFTSFNPTGCSGIHPLAPALTSVAGGVALKFAAAAGPAAPIVLAAGAALQVFSLIFAHHAQAVAKEQSVICAAVPAASDSLTAIDGAVQSGTLTPQQGSAAMDNLLSSFTQTVQSILKMDSSHCNAACVWIKQLTAIVAKKKADYADLAAQQAANPVGTALAPITGALQPVEAAIASAGLPSWLLPAAGFFLLYKFL